MNVTFLQFLIIFSARYVKILTHTCSSSAVSFSCVSRTASLCPRASHLDFAVIQVTLSSCRVKMTTKSTDSVPETYLGERSQMHKIQVQKDVGKSTKGLATILVEFTLSSLLSYA